MTMLLAALFIATAGVPAAAVPGGAARAQATADVCRDQHDAARNATGDSNAPGARSVLREIDRAFALFRFHRRDDAIAAIKGAKKRLDQSPDLFAADSRARLDTALAALASCVSSAAPARMARLTVQARYVEDKAGQLVERSAGAGVYIRVEETPVGRTSQSGSLTAQLPSGEIRVTAIVPPHSAGERFVTLPPGGANTVAVILDREKEVEDETDLVLVEGHDGVLRADAASLSLRFVDGARPVVVERIKAIELLNSAGNVTRDLTRLFRVSGTAIVAADPRAVIAALASDPSVPIRVRVAAADSAGFVHWNQVWFQIRK
jgi:hypothetical protein